MIKKKQIWPLSIQRYQILWVRLQSFLTDPQYVHDQISQLRNNLCHHSGDIFIQLGLIDPLCQYHSTDLKDPLLRQDIRARRVHLQDMLHDRRGFKTTVRENMPMANVTIDCTQPRDLIQKNFSTSCRNHIKKWLSHHYTFEPKPNTQDIKAFFPIRQETMHAKWVYTITEQMYYNLLDYLAQGNQWGLFLVKHKHDIVSWSICLIDEATMLYLYGASNRSRGNTGGHHLLKYHLIDHAIQTGLQVFDFFWASPTGYDDHHLIGVSRFKESFGWIKTEYYGSYDIVVNRLLYQLMQWRSQL